MARAALTAASAYRSSPRARRGAAVLRLPLGLVLPLGVLLLWQAVAAAGLVGPDLLPPPSQVLATLLAMARSGELARHLLATVSRLGIGFAIGAVAATLLGSLTGTSSTARRLLDPLLQGLRSVPSIAWVPLFIIWLGIAEGSKIALIAVGAFFPVYLNLMAGIARVDPGLVDVARVHGLTRTGILRHVLLQASLPAYLTGLRGGLGLAWMFVAAAELMGASEGLGFLLTDGEQTGRPDTVIAAILLFALLGRVTDQIVAVAADRVLARRGLQRGAA